MTAEAWVTQTTPLRVKLAGASTDGSARLVTRGDTYAPAVGAKVLVDVSGSVLYVLGSI